MTSFPAPISRLTVFASSLSPGLCPVHFLGSFKCCDGLNCYLDDTNTWSRFSGFGLESWEQASCQQVPRELLHPLSESEPSCGFPCLHFELSWEWLQIKHFLCATVRCTLFTLSNLIFTPPTWVLSALYFTDEIMTGIVSGVIQFRNCGVRTWMQDSVTGWRLFFWMPWAFFCCLLVV